MKKDIKNPGKCCGIYYIKAMETYCVSYKTNTVNKNSKKTFSLPIFFATQFLILYFSKDFDSIIASNNKGTSKRITVCLIAVLTNS